MGINVRDYEPEDDRAIAELERAVYAHRVTTPVVVGWLVESAPPEMRARRVVAERNGLVVGTAHAGIDFESGEPGQGFVEVAVHPRFRRSGVGSALLVEAERHLREVGAVRILTWVSEDELSSNFASRRGYRPLRSLRILRLDLSTGQPPEPAPSNRDVHLVTGAEFAADPHPLYELDTECVADEPGDGPIDPMSFDAWLAVHWSRPDFDHELTSVALVDGVPVSFSIAHTDGRDRYWSGMAGTRRTFRGRGLAKLAKGHSLRRARAAGYTEAFASNDSSNAPMLAVNEWFGYTTCAVEHRCVRDVRAGGAG